MTDPSRRPPPGWYHAEGDPEGSHRYWDGNQWVGSYQWGPVPGVPPTPAMPYYPSNGYLPELGRTLADPGRRIVARLLDGLIIGVALLVPIFIWLAQTGAEADDLQDPPGWFALLGLAALAYEIGFIALRGATPGKMAMGIAVIRHDGASPPGWRAAGLRYVLNLVGLVPVLGPLAGLVLLVVSFVFLFTDERRRTVEDRIASTYVVDTRG